MTATTTPVRTTATRRASHAASGSDDTLRSVPVTNGGVAPDNATIPHKAESERERDPAEFRMNRIAARAHEIYDARGGEHGKAMDDWLQAEREIDGEIAASQDEG